MRRRRTKVFFFTAKEYRAWIHKFDPGLLSDLDRKGWKLAGQVTLTYYSDGSAEARLPLRDGDDRATRIIVFESGSDAR